MIHFLGPLPYLPGFARHGPAYLAGHRLVRGSGALFKRAMKRTLAADSTPTAVPLEPLADTGILRYADITSCVSLRWPFGTLIFLLSLGVILGTPRDEEHQARIA